MQSIITAERTSGGIEQPTAAYALSVRSIPAISLSPAVSGVSCKRARVKPGRCFFLTLDVQELFEDVRQDFLSSFDDLVRYCISIEKSCKSERVSYHLHAFLEFSSKIFYDDLREYVACLFPDHHFDLQFCKSSRNCLKYISKEDTALLTNCKTSDLNFNYQCFIWASNVSRFYHNDPFVVMHRFCYRFLRQYFDDFKRRSIGTFRGYQAIGFAYCNWSMSVAVWWNDVISLFVHKRKCLYLYGDTNVGKSTFVETCIGRVNMKYVFYPGVGKFFMQDFDESVHKIILFEEFEYKFCVVSMLKRLLEGKPYAYPVKCGLDKIFVFRGPIIFVSNFNDVEDVALKSRLYFVSAETPYWEGIQAALPKKEVCEEEASFEISSDEEKENCPPSRQS